jgi:hypothetical protein
VSDDPGFGRHTFRNEPGQAYTITCDAGYCEELTAAVVLGIEGMWLSMCKDHALAELAIQ